MKASELMIGDWVNYRPGWINEETNQVEYECGTGFPVRIEMIYYSHGEGIVQYNDGENDGIEAAEYELFPIPLTPEILEKNGFRHGDGFEKRWYDVKIEDKKVSLYQSNTFYTLKIDEGIWPKLNNIYIHFVHELQHALRLCGIEKEIKL